MIEDIEARADAEPLLASAIVEVRQMGVVHLPRLLESYADIAPAHRAEVSRATGRFATCEFNAALDRMLYRLRALANTSRTDRNGLAG